MMPVKLARMLRKQTFHAAKVSREIPDCIAWIPPEIAVHTSRYLEAQAQEMQNILMSLVVTECDTLVRDSATGLVSGHTDLATLTSREAAVYGSGAAPSHTRPPT